LHFYGVLVLWIDGLMDSCDWWILEFMCNWVDWSSDQSNWFFFPLMIWKTWRIWWIFSRL